jgi:hypothetical protein
VHVRAQDSDDPISLLLSYPRAAQALDLTEQALRDLVWKQRGPVVTKIGRRRMFALTDLQDFVDMARKLARVCTPNTGC